MSCRLIHILTTQEHFIIFPRDSAPVNVSYLLITEGKQITAVHLIVGMYADTFTKTVWISWVWVVALFIQ